MAISLKDLTICTFNVRGVMPCTHYLCELMSEQGIDIMCISEHWLYPDSLAYLNSIDTTFDVFSKADSSLNVFDSSRRGKGGLGILWRKDLSSLVSKLYLDDDRLTGICVHLQNNAKLFIINVYMPSTDYPIELYREYVQKVSDIYEEYNSVGQVLLVGDWNAELSGDRYSARSDSQSTELQLLCESLDVTSMCVSSICKGPTYTFDPFESGKNRSFIDHVLIPCSIFDTVKSCDILMDKPFNSSDHLPIIFSLDIEPISVPVVNIHGSRPNWKKANQEAKLHYANVLDLSLQSKCVSTLSDTEYYHTLVNTVTDAASKCIPHTKFIPHLKPYWHKLDKCHAEMRRLRNIWINSGRLKGDNSFFRNFKSAKRDFRRLHRQEKAAEDRKFFEEVDEDSEINVERFFNHVKKSKCKVHSKVQELEYKGKILRQPKEIVNAFAHFFKTLYTPSEDPCFDNVHLMHVRTKLVEFLHESNNNNCPIMDKPVNLAEVQTASRSLKPGKAAGADAVTNEHIRFGGLSLQRHICLLFNRIHEAEDMPDVMKEGLMITLLKDSKKHHRDINNHRGITLLSAFYKLWERIMLARLFTWKAENNVIIPDPLQFAYQKQLSCLHVSFSVQESILHNLERGSKVYTCFLDTRKAFDVVWHEGLFYKLFELGINGKAWRTMKNVYHGMTSRVLFQGEKSEKFNVCQSVRQGGVLSCQFYMIFINAVVRILRESGYGAYVRSIYCGIFLQADDAVLEALTPYGLQRMINIYVDYANMWRFQLNPTKCKVSVYGESLQAWKRLSPSRVWRAGSDTIQEFRSVKHVGIILDAGLTSSVRTKNACTKGRGSLLSLAGSGVRPQGLNPLTSAKLYKQTVLPCALYGSELWWNITLGDQLKLEQMHRFCIKVIQDLPRRTRTDMCQSLLGIPSLEHFIDRRKLIFARQLTVLPQECIAKQIFLIRLCQAEVGHLNMKGCIPDLLQVLTKYDLYHMSAYSDAAVNFPNKATWKALINNTITQKATQSYELRTTVDSDFERFNRVKAVPLYPSSHWLCAFKIPGSLPVMTNATKMLTYVKCKTVILCEFCGELYNDSIYHKATTCISTCSQRQEFFECLTDNFSVNVSALINNMNDEELLDTLLGACSPELDTLMSDDEYTSFFYLCTLYLYSIRSHIYA